MLMNIVKSGSIENIEGDELDDENNVSRSPPIDEFQIEKKLSSAPKKRKNPIRPQFSTNMGRMSIPAP